MAVPPAMTIYGVTTVTPEREGGSGLESLHVLPPGSRFEIGGHSFLPFFFAEKSSFFGGPWLAFFCTSRSCDTQFSLSAPHLTGGPPSPGNLLYPSRGIRLSPDPDPLPPDLRESCFSCCYPIICVEVMRAYEKESVWRTADLGDRDLWG